MINRDIERYEQLLKAIASLSGLFSANTAPYIDSRFVEKLFVETTNSIDLTRVDKSFDAIAAGNVGVGVKTFIAGKGSHKKEKVAEFTSLARQGLFANVKKEELVQRVAQARNERVMSDAIEYGIDLENSVYHCLVRFDGGAVVHEEPYHLIDVDNLRPTSSSGKIGKSWGTISNGVYFTDGLSLYTYNISKNVLIKRFNFDRSKNPIDLEIHPDPLDLLESLLGRNPSSAIKRKAIELSTSHFLSMDENEDLRPGVDYVVLPLYSLRDHEVPLKSGLNQWNAAGRTRAFGEAYISIPALIHKNYPGFFPSRDKKFDLKLANSKELYEAKVCQDGSKALMTSPNHLLGKWLLGVIDPLSSVATGKTAGPGNKPITYSDLERIGKDAVRVVKRKQDSKTIYELEFSSIGSYEDFISDEV